MHELVAGVPLRGGGGRRNRSALAFKWIAAPFYCHMNLDVAMILRICHSLSRRLFATSTPSHVTCMRRNDGERAQFDPTAPTVLFLHGILGSGKNWSSFAKRVAQQCALQALLIDLRCHGA